MESTKEVVWCPADIYLESRVSHGDGDGRKTKTMALVVLNQPLELHIAFCRRLWGNTFYHVAADGGANRVYEKENASCIKGSKDLVDLPIDTIIGDLDSVKLRVQKYYREHSSAKIIKDGDQYSTDFMKAVNHIREVSSTHGPDSMEARSVDPSHRLESSQAPDRCQPPLDIVCLGGLGGRVDQAFAQIHQLYTLQNANYSSGKVFLISTEAISFVLKTGQHRIKVRDLAFEQDGIKVGLGKEIGIIPIKEPSVISTMGLEWDVQEWTTEFGGQMSTSNHVKEDWAVVQTSKDVLFTIHLISSGDAGNGSTTGVCEDPAID